MISHQLFHDDESILCLICLQLFHKLLVDAFLRPLNERFHKKYSLSLSFLQDLLHLHHRFHYLHRNLNHWLESHQLYLFSSWINHLYLLQQSYVHCYLMQPYQLYHVHYMVLIPILVLLLHGFYSGFLHGQLTYFYVQSLLCVQIFQHLLQLTDCLLFLYLNDVQYWLD